MWRLGLILVMIASLSGCAGRGNQWVDSDWLEDNTATVDSTQCTYTWTRPTTGTPVVRYLIQSSDGREWTALKEKRRITVPVASRHRVRVQGIDAHDRSGPFSIWSEWWPGSAPSDTLERRDDHEIKP